MDEPINNQNPGSGPAMPPPPPTPPTPTTPPPAPEHHEQSVNKNTGMALLAYFLFFVPLLIDEVKDDPFVKFHVKQGLVLFIAWVTVGMVGWVPVVGWAWSLLVLIVWILGVINAVNGKEKEVPVLGKFAEKFHF